MLHNYILLALRPVLLRTEDMFNSAWFYIKTQKKHGILDTIIVYQFEMQIDILSVAL